VCVWLCCRGLLGDARLWRRSFDVQVEHNRQPPKIPPPAPQALSTFASLFARDTRVPPAAFLAHVPVAPPETETQLRRAEEAYRVRRGGEGVDGLAFT
jgi:hypothetical protein